MPRAYHLFVVALLAAACDRGGNPEREREMAGRALRGVLAYPRSTMVSVSAGNEAAQLVMTSADSVQTVAAWFRNSLPVNGWQVQREVAGRGGELTIYAQKGDRPLWLTLRPNAGAAGTTYTMVGAIPVDSAHP